MNLIPLKDRVAAFFSPQNTFALLGILFGLAMIFITLPFQVPDESEHLYRAYQISTGRFIAEKREDVVGGEIPLSILKFKDHFASFIWQPENKADYNDDFKNFFQDKLEPKQTNYIKFANTALYSPAPYLPTILVFTLGRWLNSAPIVLFYVARILTLFIYLVLIYLAIKATPIAKWVFALVALMPMSIYLAASLSADAMTIAYSLLLIALIIKNIGQDNISKKDLAIIPILSFAVALSKQAYFILPLLALLIPFGKFKSFRLPLLTYSFFIFSTIILPLTALAIWAKATKAIYVPMLDYVHPAEQIDFILHNPTQVIGILYSNTESWFRGGASASIVGQLGWLDIGLPWWILASYKVALVLAFINEPIGQVLSISKKLLIGLALLAEIFTISLLMYITWNPVGATWLEGLQGRYFIPIIPLLALALQSKFIQAKKNFNPALLFLVYVSAVLYTTLMILKTRFYL